MAHYSSPIRIDSQEPRSLARPRALKPGDRLAVLCVSGPADPQPLATGLDPPLS
jgi:hypothetical protein